MSAVIVGMEFISRIDGGRSCLVVSSFIYFRSVLASRERCENE